MDANSDKTIPRSRKQSLLSRLYPDKLAPPQQPKDVVRRERILSCLLAADTPVVALVAPAGFGKTMVLGQLHSALRDSGVATAWLAVDDRDNDFSRFVVYLREAIGRLSVQDWTPDYSITSDTESPFSDLRAQAFELVDLVAALPHPFALFIDEFEKIHSADVIWMIGELIGSLNPGQRIFIGSRTLRAMPLTPLAISGRLTRVELEALRFDVAETSIFFRNQSQVQLSDQEVRMLRQKTEGWPAMLRLVTLALPGLADAAQWIEDLSGRTDSIALYLAENVLARLPERLCRFMLRISIVEFPYGNLCDALLDSRDSDSLLTEIHAANLFLSRVDESASTYEFHSLFRSFLATELRRTDPAIIPLLHRRAAVFYSSSGRYADAIFHAMEAGDQTLAIDIIELCALRFVELGQLESVARWTDSLPADDIAERPNTQRARAYAMIAMHRYDEAQEALANLRRIAHRKGQELDIEANMQLALMYEWMDRHDLSAPEVAKFSETVDPNNHLVFGYSRNMVAFLSTIAGDYTRAQQALTSAKSVYGKVGLGSWPSTYTTCFEGCIEMIHGNTRAAVQRFETALGQTSSAGQSIPSAFLADALYSRGDIDRAGSLAEEHLRLNRHIAPPDIVILSYRTAARVSFLNGNLDHAEALLTELGDIGDMRGLSRLKASAWLEKSRLALLCGDADSATRYRNLGSNPKIWSPHKGAQFYAQELDDPEIAAMRMDLVLGDADAVATRLEQRVKAMEQSGRRWRRMRLQCLLAQAYARQRRRKNAVELMQDTLLASANSEMVYVFADEPWFLVDILEELPRRNSQIDSGYLQQVTAATKLVAQRIGELLVAKTQNSLLSLKETAIIRLVADGKANKEIARILNITDNTVETHLRRINLKLDVRNRTHAVAKARELGLLR